MVSSLPVSAKSHPRVVRHVGKDPAAVDPYWDFERLPGEPYDASALRLWRLRVFVSKPARARLSMAHGVAAPEPSAEGARRRPIAPEEHIFRYDGGPEREAGSYTALGRSMVDVSPPSTTFVVNLTKLDPGDFAVRASVLGARQEEREMKFRIVRRPFYSYPALAAGKTPVVRSHTGVRPGSLQGVNGPIVGYRWKLERWAWESGAYLWRGEMQVEARAVVGSSTPVWQMRQDAAEGSAAEERTGWEAYLAETGLPAPTLLGLGGR